MFPEMAVLPTLLGNMVIYDTRESRVSFGTDYVDKRFALEKAMRYRRMARATAWALW